MALNFVMNVRYLLRVCAAGALVCVGCQMPSPSAAQSTATGAARAASALPEIQADSPLFAELRGVSPEFDALADEQKALFLLGKTEEAESALLAKMRASGDRPVHRLVVANMLYSIAPATSRRLHAEVYAMRPADPSAAIEHALEEHRAGEFGRAADVYSALAKADKLSNAYVALYADCLLHLGRQKEAVAAWEKADHPRHHVAIEEALHAVYGALSPWRRRADLLKRFNQGDDSAADAIVKLDLA
jgi:thioredoxin-like negative regulator of GroEL